MRNAFLRNALVLYSALSAFIPLASAQSATTQQFGTVGTTAPVTQTTTYPIHTFNSGTSIGAFGTTTVTGGSTTNGSGGVVPNNQIGSSSTTGGGLSVTIPIPACSSCR